MAWQDELRQLEQALAAGQITPDEHRRRREDVLSAAAQASTFTPPPVPRADQPGDEGANETTAMIPPVPAAAPAHPPVSAESTQIVPNADQTQVVREQAMPHRVNTPPPGFPSPYAAAPSSPPSPVNNGWRQVEDASPPWAGQTWPPSPAPGGWAPHGAEVFEDAKSGGRGKKIAVIVGVVVLLAGLSVGAWWLWGSGSQNTSAAAQQTNTSQNSPSQDRKPGDPLQIADLGGKRENHEKIKTFEDVLAAKFLTTDEVKLYTDGGAEKTRVAGTVVDNTRATVFIAQMKDKESAKTAVDELGKLQLRYAFTEYKDAPAGVVAGELAPKPNVRAGVRAHYQHENLVVRVEVRGQEPTTDLNTVRDSFNKIIKLQLEALSANA
ncbi:hypothetical protein [Streptoalloteichus tenebrarius]|uniref:hypothetical protein n=1 Tax=Streptoalloteichus tenebrarius (strain ATCC 17920 / DSM 40477 / JCM 4838 / CBS 697.72 / NBRC 16177 / NCIMB 11028 / NRRL B-12390 / A12253. 1 / ISP 5477) TaxID=1933 RepID=UPI0020A5658C|nr:hypothetical protein [Streptoalloteichus tenebrarius]